MKRYLITLIAAGLVGTVGCSKSDTEAPTDGVGRIALTSTVDCDLATRAAVAPAVGDFALRITGPDYDCSWEHLSDFPAEDTYFTPGTYRAAVSWGDPEAEGADAWAFYGESSFEIRPRQTVPVAIAARIVHAAVTVRATEAFMRYFHDAHFTVTTAAGHDFDFTPGASEAPVYVKAGASLSVAGSALRQTGDAVTFPVQKLDATVARTCHAFTFDAPDAGSVALTIDWGEEYVETRLLPVIELNEGAIPDTREPEDPEEETEE